MRLSAACIRARDEWISCRDASDSGTVKPRSIDEIVSAYIQHKRRGAGAEIDYYANLPTVKEAVLRAAKAERPDGKRHDHQRRIGRAAIRKAAQKLRGLRTRGCREFHDLFLRIEATIGDVEGVGDLMVYDTSVRIGARLGLEPDFIYLHAGTRSGAQALGLRVNRDYLEPRELPSAFRRLSGREIEDCLCIYKDRLHNLRV